MKADYFKNERYIEIEIEKNVASEFKIFDILEDNGSKTWIVNKINLEENLIEVIKFPFVANKLVVINLNLNDSNTKKLITKVFR